MTSKRVPPYLSFSTFKSFLESLRVSGIPTRIDRSVMASKSGSTQVLLLAAIRYLGLASDIGIPTPELERLVHASGKARREMWHAMLRRAYPNLFKLDLQRATTQQASDVLTKEGVSSQDTVRKALNFFCLASKEAGIELSPHITPSAGSRVTKKARSATIPASNTTPREEVRRPEINSSSEWQMLLAKFPNFDPGWPEDLRTNWLEGFERLSEIFKGEMSQKD